jgi:hypothetical protein
MNNFDHPPLGGPPEPQPQQQGSGCGTALLLVLGVLLLLPGLLCAIITPNISSARNNPIAGAVSLLAIGGLMLILWAFVRKSRS